MLYAVFPGTITTHEDEVVTLTYEELIMLYGVDEEDCVLGTEVPQNRLMFYIRLMPRPDNNYPNITDQVELGDEIKWGPNFDGKKRYTMETNFDALYSEQNAERKP